MAEQQIGLFNADGTQVDIYIPRKCAITNSIIGPKDHQSVQINVAVLNEKGVYKGQYETVAFCGKIRAKGEIDNAFTILAQEKGLMKKF